MPAPTNDSQRLNPLIRALHAVTAWLESHDIPYMVFGGVANSLYGNPRQTFDIDIKFNLPQQMEAASFLEALGEEAEILPEDPKRFLNETNVIPIEIDGVRVDLVLGELPFEIEAIQRSRLMNVFGREIRVCLPEDLVIQKAVSNRQKDWMDIQEIIRLQGHTMDREYLLGHAKDLSDFLSDPGIHDRIKGWIDDESL